MSIHSDTFRTETEKGGAMNVFYTDDHFVKEDQAMISVNDLGLLRGYGVFDFLRTYNLRPFHLEDHIRRLETSARLLDLPMPRTRRQILDITMETLSRNDLTEANIRIVITGGVSPDSITPGNNPKLLVMVTPQHPYPEEWYRNGVTVITTCHERYIPGAKSTHYLPAIIALSRARRENAVEAVYTDRYNRILEGTTTNFFAFFGDHLVTPGTAVLPGITRQVVLKLMQNEFDIDIRDIQKNEIPMMDEIFITASNKEILPVVRMDDRTLGDGTPGPRTRWVMKIFAAYTCAYGEGKD